MLARMLKAMLRGKLGRPSDNDENGDAHTSAWIGLTAREDPLTSTVFERFAYLEPGDAWTLLRAACAEPALGDEIPIAAPVGAPIWWFWPRLSPGEAGSDARHVEPDLLIVWGPLVLVVEAKHAGAQCAAQWVRELRAVQGDARFAQKRAILVAAGGTDAARFARLTADVRKQLGVDRAGFLLLRWTALREAATSLRPHLSPGAVAVVDDMIAALDAWGYRRRVGFDSLPEAARNLAIATTPAALKDWRI